MKTAFSAASVMVLALALAGCGGSSSTPPAGNPSADNSSSSSTLVQPKVFAQKKMDLASLTQAVQQYNAAEGHLPAQLSDLVPTYIAKIPQAPPGYKFNYDPNSGSVTLAQQ